MRRVGVIAILVLVVGLLGPGAIPTGGAGPALYPDLRSLPPSGMYLSREWLADGLQHYLLRFSMTSWNAGEGRLELQGDPNPNGSSDVFQNLYDARQGGTRVQHNRISADLIYHPNHYHYHLEGFAEFSLQKKDGNGIYQPTTRRGAKTSFCILDSEPVGGNAVPNGQFWSCDSTLQGLSVGWGDVYYASLPGQYIDLGTAYPADGDYAAKIVADPWNKIAEAGRDNNNSAITYFALRGGAISSLPAPPVCSVSRTSGPVGTGAPVSCTGFSGAETVRVHWDTTTAPALASFVASGGAGGVTAMIPETFQGGHTLVMRGATSGRTAGVLFNVTPSLALQAGASTVGTAVTATLRGYRAGETVALAWRGPGSASQALPGATANGLGSATVGFTVPATTYGLHRVEATGNLSGGFAGADFFVGGSLALAPATGAAGQSVVASVRGFGAAETARLVWDPGLATAAQVGQATIAANGDGTITFVVPAAATGAHAVEATGATSGARSRVSFTVSGSATATATATKTATPTATATATATNTATKTAIPTVTRTPPATATGVATGVATSTRTATPVATPNRTPTRRSIATRTPTRTPIPTSTPPPPPLATATAEPSPSPTPSTVPATATTVPPTATTVPPTATTVPPTATTVPPTATTVPPTATNPPPTATAIPTQPPPTATVAPVAYRIVGSGRSANSSSSYAAFDNNLATIWASTVAATPPTVAYVYVDLGSAKPIGAVRWTFGVDGLAPEVVIQVSTDRVAWTSVTAPFAGGPAGQWQEIRPAVSARYVRWYFVNPSGIAQIGGLAEVQIWP